MGNFFSGLRRFSQNTPGFGWMYLLARNSGLTKIVAGARRKLDPKRGEKCAEFDHYYQEHVREFNEVQDLFADDLSRKILAGVLEFRRTGDRDALKGLIEPKEYFPKDIVIPVEDEVFVDGGAYVGDTVESFIKDFAEGGGTKEYLPGNLIRSI